MRAGSATRGRAGLGQPHGRLERASVSVLTAGVLFLAGALSLVAVDLLRAVLAQAQAQAAADAAALAAAQELAIPSGAWTPAEAARSYAERNGASLLECRCDPGSQEAVVHVAVAVRLVFVGPDRTAAALARAVVGTGPSRRGALLPSRPEPGPGAGP